MIRVNIEAKKNWLMLCVGWEGVQTSPVEGQAGRRGGGGVDEESVSVWVTGWCCQVGSHYLTQIFNRADSRFVPSQ